MKRRLFTSDGRHKTTQTLIRSGLRILSVLALAFVLVGADPFWSVQAVSAGAMFNFVITAVPTADYVCTHQRMTIWVYVSRQLMSRPGDVGPKFDNIGGVKVNAELADKSLGSIGDMVVVQKVPGPGFLFTAGKKPGTTKIYFSAMIPYIYGGEALVETYARVEVRNCGYKIDGWNEGYGNSGGLNCSSPYGPWDLLHVDRSNSLRVIVPFSEDGNATATAEAYLTPNDPVGSHVFSMTKVTITPMEWGFQMKFQPVRWVGIGWAPNISVKLDYIDPGQGLGPFDIVPVEPGECP